MWRLKNLLDRVVIKIRKIWFEKKYGELLSDDQITIVVVNSIGDTLYTLMFLHNLKKHHPQKRITLVCHESKRCIVELFSQQFDRVVYLDTVELKKFWDREYLLFKYYFDRIRLVCPGIYFKECFDYIKSYPGIDFANFIKYSILKLDKQDAPFVPDVFGLRYDEERYSFPAGKAVILCPYANSLNKVKWHFWEALALKLRESGYTVYTNSGSDTEPIIEGTIRLKCGMLELLAIARDAGHVVGLRSGILDWLLLSGAKMVALYPDDQMLSFYDINAVISSEQVEQYVVTDDLNQDIKHICEVFECES